MRVEILLPKSQDAVVCLAPTHLLPTKLKPHQILVLSVAYSEEWRLLFYTPTEDKLTFHKVSAILLLKEGSCKRSDE